MNNERKREKISFKNSADSFYIYYIPSLLKVQLRIITKPNCK